jgi:TonB family protein
MTNAAVGQRARSPARKHAASPAPKKQKLSAFLVTGDVDLWPQVGTHLTQKLIHRQIDSLDELLNSTPPGQPGIVLWDARECPDRGAELERLQAHSASFAIIAFDVAGADAAWESAVRHGRIVAFAPLPIDAELMSSALANAYDEASARAALLGEAGAASGVASDAGSSAASGALSAASPAESAARTPRGRLPLLPVLGIAAAVIGCIASVVYFSRDNGSAHVPAPTVTAATPTAHLAGGPAAGAPATAAAEAGSPTDAATEEKVDALIDQAQRAMRDRHFIDPADGSALALYRSALTLNPGSGEARQGLQRLAEILLARVQSALDERQFDAALQALETARSINPEDSRLPALDERIVKLRAEIGPAEILAAINAQNFDRAAQLIDGASRTKALTEQKLNQLREELRRHQTDSDVSGLVARIDARMQQDQLVDPPNDSAAYYLNQAKHAGASAAELQPQLRELTRRLTLAAHGAVEQGRLADADKLAADLKNVGAAVSVVAGVQHEIGVARAEQGHAQTDQSRFLDLARSRLTQGNIIEPENDNALYYLNQLRSSDPQNSELPQLSKSVQAQILEQARTALDGGQSAQAATLLQLASVLGPSTELDALNERMRMSKLFAASAPREVTEASLTRARKLEVDYPRNALEHHVEGAVELGYTVTAKGAVADIKVLDSNPPGVFEKAASDAVARLRYKPVLEDGKAVAVATKMLVKFRVQT